MLPYSSPLRCLGGLRVLGPEMLFLQGSDRFPEEVLWQDMAGGRGGVWGADTALTGIHAGSNPRTMVWR